MKSNRPNFAVLIIAAILLLPGFGLAQEITFTYNPPNMTKAITYSSDIDTSISMMGTYTRKRFDKSEDMYFRTDTNFACVSNLISTESYVDGEKLDVAQLQPLVGLPITAFMDFNGHLDSLGGYMQMRDSILINEIHEVAEYFPHYFDYEPFFIGMSAEWNNQTADFAGKTVHIGDTWELADTIINIDCTKYVNGKIRFVELREYNGVRCIVIEYEKSIIEDYTEMFADALANYYTDMDLPIAETSLEILPSQIEIKGTEIIDPATMLIHYIYEESTELARLNIYGGLNVVIQTRAFEKDSTVYEYLDE